MTNKNKHSSSLKIDRLKEGIELAVKWPRKSKKPKYIFLVRHGQTDFNLNHAAQGWLDTYLNANGYRQALSLAKKLARVKIDFIFSSDLKRACQTAQIINNKYHSSPIIKTHLLRERQLGLLSGQKIHINNKIIPPPILNLDFKSLEGWTKDLQMETRNKFQQRIKDFFKLLNSYPIEEKTILIVSHGATLRTMLKMLQAPLPKDFFFSNSQLIICTPLDISKV